MRIGEIKSFREMFYGIAVSTRGRRYKWYWMVDMFDVTRQEPWPGVDKELWASCLVYRRHDGSEGWRDIVVPGLRVAVEKAIRGKMN